MKTGECEGVRYLKTMISRAGGHVLSSALAALMSLVSMP